jgi:hypothetical protein
MAPYAPAHVQLLPSWDNGPYSPVLDVDDRYPTIEPSEDQYSGPYLSNVLPPLSAATSLLRSPSHRHSWSCHSSDEHQQCCGDSGDSPQYRQIPFTDGDYVYSPDGYLPSQHIPSDHVSSHSVLVPASRLIFVAISLLFSTSSPMVSHCQVQTPQRFKWMRKTRQSRCSTLEEDQWEVGRIASDHPLGLRALCPTHTPQLIPMSPPRNRRHHSRRRRRHRTSGAVPYPRFNAPSLTTSPRDTRMPNPC